jgi:hypothetical protein
MGARRDFFMGLAIVDRNIIVRIRTFYTMKDGFHVMMISKGFR